MDELRKDVEKMIALFGYTENEDGLMQLFINVRKNIEKVEEKLARLEALEACGVDNWIGYSEAMNYLETGEL